MCILSTRWSLRVSNAIGVVKVLTLILYASLFFDSVYVRRLINICSSISITGLVVLGGHTRVEDPHANFRNAFDGTSHNGNGLATALIRVNFAYGGYEVK